MKTSNDAKMTVCSIAVTLSILLITLGVYFGTQYLDENYVKYDVEQMLNVCNQIPDPTERKGETITIDKRWIVKSVIANRIYPELSNQDGVNFFSDYARKQDWAICTNRWDLDNRTGKHTYYLTLKRKKLHVILNTRRDLKYGDFGYKKMIFLENWDYKKMVYYSCK